MTAIGSTWISTGTRSRLESEVAQLYREREVISAQVVEHRNAGDLDNNDAYHRANAHLDHIESRATRLQGVLSAATTTAVSDGTVQPGTVVTVMFDHDADDVTTFLLAVPEEHETVNLQVCSPHSPLGEALRGAQPGDERHYRLPNGNDCSATVMACASHTA